MSRRKWRTITQGDIAELRQAAEIVIFGGYKRMRDVASALGESSNTFMEWVTLREAETRQDLDGFLVLLGTASEGHPNDASRYLSPDRETSIFSDGIDSGATAITNTTLRYTNIVDGHAAEFERLRSSDDFSDSDIGGSFTLSQWAASNVIREIEFTLQSYMESLFVYTPGMGSNAVQRSVIVPAIEAVKDWILSLYGVTFTPTDEMSGYQRFVNELEMYVQGVNKDFSSGVIADTIKRVDDIAAGVDAENPMYDPLEYTMQDYEDIRSIVERGSRVYLAGDAIEIYRLDISPERAWELITKLDFLNAAIPIDRRGEFEQTYKILWTYAAVTGTEPMAWQTNPEYSPRVDYETHLSEDLMTMLDNEWSSMIQAGVYGYGTALSGQALRWAAKKKGLDAELNVRFGNDFDDLMVEVNDIKKDSWNGPVMPEPITGFYIPIDGFREAEDLYTFWLRGRIYSKFEEIEAWLETASADGDLSFVMTRDIAEAELTRRQSVFDGALSGGGLTQSVADEKWDLFAGIVYGMIGAEIYTQEEILDIFDTEQAVLLSAGRMEKADLMASVSTEMPSVYADAKQIVDWNQLNRLTDYEINQMYMKLLEYRWKVPVDVQLEYEDIMSDFRGSLEEFRGGVRGAITTESDADFVARQEERLLGVFEEWTRLAAIVMGGSYGITALISSLMNQGLLLDIGRPGATELSILSDAGSERIESLRFYEGKLRENEVSFVASVRTKMEELVTALSTWSIDQGMAVVDEAKAYALITHPSLQDLIPALNEALGKIGYANIEDNWEEEADRMIRDLDSARLGGYSITMGTHDYALILVDEARGRSPEKVARIEELLDIVPATSLGGHLPIGSGLPPFTHFAPLKSREDATTTSLEELIDFAGDLMEVGVFVEPKINGQRAALQVKNGEVRLFLEGEHEDWISAFYEVGQEAGVLNNIVLDGEVVDLIEDRVAPDIGTGEFTRDEIDKGTPIFLAFDILHYDGEDMEKYPYIQRRENLAKVLAGKDFKYLRMLESWFVNTEEGLRLRVQDALDVGGSEGAIVKGANGKYLFNATAPDWMKWRRTEEVDVMVIGHEVGKTGNNHYECGLEYMGEAGFAKESLAKLNGKQYVIVGTTFGTKIKASPGDTLKVRVSKIDKLPEEDGMVIEWVDPTVVSRVEDEPDSVGVALNISRVLSASISKPYAVLTELSGKISEANTRAALFALDKELFEIYTGLSFPRLRRMAWALIQQLGRRSLVVTGGVELDSRPDVEFINADVVRKAKADFEMIENSRTDTPEASLLAAQVQLDFVRGYLSFSEDDNITNQLELLKMRIISFIDMMGGPRGMSRVTIQTDLLNLRQRAYDAMSLDPSNPERTAEAVRIRQEINAIQDRAGIIIENYSDDVDKIFEYLDRIPDPAAEAELPTVTEEGLKSWTITEQMYYNSHGNSLLGFNDQYGWLTLSDPAEEYYQQEIHRSRYSNQNIQGRLDSWREKYSDLDQRLNKNDEALIDSAMIEINTILNVMYQFADGNGLSDYQEQFFRTQFEWNIIRFENLYGQWRAFKTQAIGGADTTEITKSRSIVPILQELINDRIASRGSLDNVLFERMYHCRGNDDPVCAGMDYASLRLTEITNAAFNLGAEMDMILQQADTIDDAMEDIERELQDAFNVVDRQITSRYEEIYSWQRGVEREGPQPLGPIIEDEVFWVSPGEEQRIEGFDYGASLVAAGNTIMVQGSDGDYRVTAVIDSDGSVVSGDPSKMTDVRLARMVEGIREEAIADPLAKIMLGEDESGLHRFVGGLSQGLQGSVEIVGKGNGYYGGEVDGRAFFVTNVHLADEQQIPVRLPDGRVIQTIVRWKGADEADWQDFDVAILEATEPVELNMEPLSLGTYKAEGARNVYGTVIAPLLGEAELVKLGFDEGLDPYFSQSSDVERTRGGYSGGPVVDELGNVVGLWSAGAPTSWSRVGEGFHVDTYGAVVPLSRLQEAYFRAGVVVQEPLGGAALGNAWNNTKADYSPERLMNSIPPAIRKRAKEQAKKENRPVSKEDMKLRYKDPDGKVNPNGVRAALRKLGQTKLPQEIKATTKKFLSGLLKKLGKAENNDREGGA